MAFVHCVHHSSFILSCNLIGQQENKSCYVMEIVLPLGFADVFFFGGEKQHLEIRLCLHATCNKPSPKTRGVVLIFFFFFFFWGGGGGGGVA